MRIVVSIAPLIIAHLLRFPGMRRIVPRMSCSVRHARKGIFRPETTVARIAILTALRTSRTANTQWRFAVQTAVIQRLDVIYARMDGNAPGPTKAQTILLALALVIMRALLTNCFLVVCFTDVRMRPGAMSASQVSPLSTVIVLWHLIMFH